ncbi:hypothetical protein VISI1226_14168, partial [Vibrio sinaloensis DSM 21326]
YVLPWLILKNSVRAFIVDQWKLKMGFQCAKLRTHLEI